MQKLLEKVKSYFTASDMFRYEGWLVSDHFYKRVLAFMGYTTLALIGIELVLLLVGYCVSIVRSIAS
jgi:hypothetical protein